MSFKKRKTNENGLKTLSFNDKDKIKDKVNSIRFDFIFNPANHFFSFQNCD